MQNPSWRLHNWVAGHARFRPDTVEAPLRAELFGVEQLTRHAKSLAANHQVVTRQGSNGLLARLVKNEDILRAFNRSTLALSPGRRITPAAEWLLDNFYLIEEQIQMARRHLPRGYSRELPRLLSGPSTGFPRVYDIVLELIAHVDAQIDPESLTAFVAAYQTVAPLKLGELWAIPIMLRLGLIENLQRITTRLILAREDRDLASRWVERLQYMAEQNPSRLVVVVADMAKSALPLSSSFVAEFCRRLSLQSPVLHLSRAWLEQRLADHGMSIEQLVHQEGQNQAADQVSVSHSISSLRFLSASDWKDFVETLSRVEETLRTDPPHVYQGMDFPTRDRYRHSVEFFARNSNLSEADVARSAIQLAADSAARNGSSDRTAHVGFYLIDKGRSILGRKVNVNWPWRTILERAIHRFPLTYYAGGIFLIALGVTAGFVLQAVALPLIEWELVFFTVLVLLCASQLAVGVVNWLSMLLVKPRLLPRLDFSSGIPADCRTMVVVPTMLTTPESVDRLLESLEIHHLANRDDHLQFALLSDFRDAATETLPGDDTLLELAQSGIALLNAKYPTERNDLFFLFHRPRRWNASEGQWMGYERKRGKLTEFNALLRGGAHGCFSTIVGEPVLPTTIRYVITLDTDTQLPRDAARQLVGTMAHPLNRPVFDPVHGVVTEGYSILQPRVGVSLPSARRSWFVRLFSGDTGIDPYTREVSDVYQDIFREGSFVGKGIYEVDAFQSALKGRFPENTVLSHDLLEACHARSGLVSDVEFYEEFPSRYSVDVDRRHRWIRGDWQITQWLLPRVPGSGARRIANPLSALSRWKILDNLRRSLVPAALLLLLVGDWLLLPGTGAFGSFLVLVVLTVPAALAVLSSALRKPADLPWRLHWNAVLESCGRHLGPIALTLAFLPYDAYVCMDAVGRTLLRLLITRKRLLEWRTSSDTERSPRADVWGFFTTMWIAPAMAVAVTGLLMFVQPDQFPRVLPILALWAAAPWIAWWISQPIETPAPDLTAEQLTFLRRTARRTWHFFETFVTAQENWLPPDNFQENPSPVIASRTSPTNIGLALLANLSAHDLGYLSVGGVIQRTRDTFSTLDRLERHRGHFFNWYETRTLRTLLPPYVSSVDSGNLAGHLLTLGAGLRELTDEPIHTAQVFVGLRDTVGILRTLVGEHAALAQLDAELLQAPDGLVAAHALLQRAATEANGIEASLLGRPGEISLWTGTLRVPPYGTIIVDLALGVADTRESALALIEKYRGARMADRVFDLAWTHSQVTLHQLNVTETEAQLYGRLAGALIYADPARRANPGILISNRRGQNGLWSYGISGDVPIILLRISDSEKIAIVQQLIQAHSYWRLKGLIVDLVILTEDVSVYRQSLHDQITGRISSRVEAQLLDKPGGIFVRRLEQISSVDRVLLQAVARIVLDDEKGTLAEQVEHRSVLDPLIPTLRPSRFQYADPAPPLPPRELIFNNGLGGFTRDGHEYVITLQRGQTTPAPWVNVLANPNLGTVVSETGASYTWFENSHEFRLTPWSNDPVQDTTGEAFYIRDERTGQFWSPTPGPARGVTPYVIRHGFGYTVFEHTEHGIASELWIYVAMDAPVKFAVLKLRNLSGRPRRLSVTGYWEWVLGDLRHKSLLHVQTEVDLRTGALLARNDYNTEFPGRIVFLDVNDDSRTLTGDRKEFIGRNGTLTDPAALKRTRLSGKVGAGLDPCGALQIAFSLEPGQERSTEFRLGVGHSIQEVQNLIRRFRRVDASQATLEGVWNYWNRTLGSVNVDTPDPAVNVMANGWLLYQTLSCRLWGRTGFYQSGGAFGFRDQLQDVMALVHAEPALTREHLLRAAAHQYREGDVLHWWHPPAGRGVRTHFSDDFLWLPYATCRYVACVADTGVLDETVPFLEGRPVKLSEEAYYDLPNRSEESATLYQHCVRAIEHGLRFGEHGLPLIGCGDWNDGMNRVGNQGRGESVWLAFFLYDVLNQFAGLARAHNDPGFADRCLTEARQLQANIERQAWDGEWYRRAFFDNGEPLGSRSNPECQIDSLPQSWSVISGAGEPHRSQQAMQSVDRRLVRRDSGLVQLFDPPFDTSTLNPGYIKGYIPGVRENGGQYTHGAVWAAMAFALLGDSERAWELFTLLNPIHHGGSPEAIAVYKVEPYVVAADVYAVAPHVGRGGWTWYTGSAGWMYRLLIETLLGVNIEGDQLRLTPRPPALWKSYKVHYRYRSTVYHITINRVSADAITANSLILDGKPLSSATIPLADDHREHSVTLNISDPADADESTTG